jgi:inner membrane protein
MDTVTQALLGASVAEAGFARRLGRRALWWGALGGLLPDLDVLAVAFDGPFGEFRYHRGITHSLWFGPVLGPLLGWGVWRLYRRRGRDPGPLAAWVGLFTLALFTHLAAWALRQQPRLAQRAVMAALALSSLYMVYGVELNREAERDVRAALAAEGHPDARVRAYPTILQPYLRRVVARLDDEIRVGLYTPLRAGGPVWERFTPPQHPLIEALASTPEGALFVWFAMEEVVGHVSPSPRGTVVELDDIRYGLPGRPDRGLWGVRGVFDRQGRLLGPVQRFERRDGFRLELGALWRAMWGDFAALGLDPGPR